MTLPANGTVFVFFADKSHVLVPRSNDSSTQMQGNAQNRFYCSETSH